MHRASTLRDSLELLVVPCLPLGRAAALANGSCVAATISIYVALAYVGGLASFGAYARDGYVVLGSIRGFPVLLAGWLLYALGPLVAWVAVVVSILKYFSCAMDGTGGPKCNPALLEPYWIALAAACFLLVAGAALHVRNELLRRIVVAPSGCCYACFVCCCMPLCAVASAMHTAREARARERVDEIPAYQAA